MKRILTPILLLTFLFPSLAYGVTMDDLVQRDGLYYKKFSDVPFTGKTTGKSQGSFKDGQKHGPWLTYYDNGQVKIPKEPTGTVSRSVIGSGTTTTDSYGTKEPTRTVRKTVFGFFTTTTESYIPKATTRTVREMVLSYFISIPDSWGPKEPTKTTKETVLGFFTE